MKNFLSDVITKKKEALVEHKRIQPLALLKEMIEQQPYTSQFFPHIAHPFKGECAIIAEIKLASPTILSLGSPGNVAERVNAYEKAGADAISFITEQHYFHGSIGMLAGLRKHTKQPILQKDFVIDSYQIYEARTIGSDALLLIAKIVEGKTLQTFVSLTQSLGIEPVVEVNDQEDVAKAIQTTAKIIAVNARDLDTLQVDLERASDLLRQIPEGFIRLGFSGIRDASDVEKYKKAGARGVLVGTALMQAKNTQEFLGGLR